MYECEEMESWKGGFDELLNEDGRGWVKKLLKKRREKEMEIHKVRGKGSG